MGIIPVEKQVRHDLQPRHVWQFPLLLEGTYSYSWSRNRCTSRIQSLILRYLREKSIFPLHLLKKLLHLLRLLADAVQSEYILIFRVSLQMLRIPHDLSLAAWQTWTSLWNIVTSRRRKCVSIFFLYAQHQFYF